MIKVKSRLASKETNGIILKHDHPFEGLCAIDMSRECIVTTDGPHEIWAPRAAELSPPNLKLWRLEEKLTDRPDAKINAQHLLISGKHILTGPKLKESEIFVSHYFSTSDCLSIFFDSVYFFTYVPNSFRQFGLFF